LLSFFKRMRKSKGGRPTGGSGSPPAKQAQGAVVDKKHDAALKELFNRGAQEQKLAQDKFEILLKEAGLPVNEAFLGFFGGDAKEADADSDGTISFEEFTTFMIAHFTFSVDGGFAEKVDELSVAPPPVVASEASTPAADQATANKPDAEKKQATAKKADAEKKDAATDVTDTDKAAQDIQNAARAYSKSKSKKPKVAKETKEANETKEAEETEVAKEMKESETKEAKETQGEGAGGFFGFLSQRKEAAPA